VAAGGRVVGFGGIVVRVGGIGVLVGGMSVAVGSVVGVSGAAVVHPVKRASKRHPTKNLVTDNLVFIFPS
jgi:hypothetical protein